MRKLIIILCLTFIGTTVNVTDAKAIPIINIIKAAIKKAIKAADLQVQKLQNKTIWLQNTQKTIENKLSKLKLEEIGKWSEKQKKLYSEYYEELKKVKSVITYYNRVRNIAEKQVKIVTAYKRTWDLIQSDKHFTPAELGYMAKVYSGMLKQSAENMEQVYMVVSSYQTQMTDAKRLEIIAAVSDRVDENYFDLTRFNNENVRLSLQRGKQQNDVDVVKKLYGIK